MKRQARLVLAAIIIAVLSFLAGRETAHAFEHEPGQGWHWPRAGEDVTIPVRYWNWDEEWRQAGYDRTVAVAQQLSAATRVNLEVVGYVSDPSRVCTTSGDGPEDFELGYIVVCMGMEAGLGGLAYSHPYCTDPSNPDTCWTLHIDAGKAMHGTPLASSFAICHELQHTLGLGESQDGCPDDARISALMNHDDGFETVAGTPTVTPTPTAHPTPTPTLTASPTPNPTPGGCWPPKAKRCR